MCGIAGLWSQAPAPGREELERMAGALRHRGPDDQGVWLDAGAGVGLAHRRLSIVDLSPAGHQPMHSASGRYALVFNGEIYNYEAMRRDVEAATGPRPWAGHCDTEVLLAGFEAWGIRGALERSNGMFAIAVWDRERRELTLARDRLGEKPLYFGWVGGRFAFASETKALAVLPGWTARLDEHAASRYLRAAYAAGPRSLIAGVFRLPPGSALTLTREAVAQPLAWESLESRLERYWSLEQVVAAARSSRRPMREDEHLERLEHLLAESVRLRLLADVPVGALLSGGVDSTTIVALAQAASRTPVRTFTAGFEDAALDEAPHAAAVARHLGTTHTELYVRSADALELIPKLPEIYDEPFADSSQIPTTLIAGLASRHVKVALSGDGGDELFAGYTRYAVGQKLWRLMAPWPGAWRRGAARVAQALAGIAAPLDMVLPAGGDTAAFRLRRLAWRASAPDIDALREALIGVPPEAARTGAAPFAPETVPPGWLRDPLDRMMYADQAEYLPDDILTKVDRASMHWALEPRIPLLDHRIVEFAWSLPRALVFDRHGGKPLLKRLLAKHVPPALTQRPKQGFEVPLAAWLRGPLRPWADSLLTSSRLRSIPVLDAEVLRRAWQRHCRGESNESRPLWAVLMLLAWCERMGAAA
ncbi:MAG: asparagine synthase (glutamine-hydrolyzing) [Clostridia bacterium]